MAAKVVLDSNALLLPFETGVRFEPELERLLGTYELLVPEAVLQELATIASQAKGQRAANARLALSLSARFGYRRTSHTGDAAILDVAKTEKAYLFTNDRDLIKRALALGVHIVRLKGKSHLSVETPQGESR